MSALWRKLFNLREAFCLVHYTYVMDHKSFLHSNYEMVCILPIFVTIDVMCLGTSNLINDKLRSPLLCIFPRDTHVLGFDGKVLGENVASNYVLIHFCDSVTWFCNRNIGNPHNSIITRYYCYQNMDNLPE